MADTSLLDVLTAPDHRRGPSVIGLVVIGALFLVPGLIAPVGVLQLVGLLWMVAAVLTLTRDLRHMSS